ncbi:MAG: tetratricopeptide repeat protein [Verrucomicrobiota bacterium]
MNASLTRARQLRDLHRHDEAVALIHAHLAQNPDDPMAFLELAMNRLEIEGAKSLALEDARRATGLLPGESFPLALQSRILSSLDREKEALPLADSAIALDPEDPYSWNSRSLALCGLHRWAEAEEAARQALALDPDDETGSNLLAHTLRLQKKLNESESESRRRLARNPENAFSFANSGWSALQRGQVKEAENFFKEALRLDPSMDYAKEGLKESFRARSAFYRLFLRWVFFIQQFSQKNRIAIIIGLIFGFKIVKALAAAVHPLLVLPVVILYYAFLFGTWLSNGLANFLILKDPVARMSLDRGEKIEGLTVGSLFLGGLVVFIAGMAASLMPVAVAGGAMMVAAIPATLIFTNSSVVGRLLFGGCLLAILGLGAHVALDVAAHANQKVGMGESAGSLSYAILIAFGTTWLSMVPALHQKKSD